MRGRLRPGGSPAVTWRGLALIGLAIAVVVAYAPAMRAPYEFDDIASIPANETIRALWPPSTPLNPPSNTTVAGRPVVNYSLALNYAINERLGVDQRPDPFGRNKTLGFHIVNLLTHLGCGLLLFGIVRRTLRQRRLAESWQNDAAWIAATTTALWLLHPIQTEAVNYVIQRTELIASACYLGTLYASIRAWDANGRRATAWRAIAIAVCLLGMGSKEMMITAPLAIILYDRAFRVSSWKGLFTNGTSVDPVGRTASRPKALFYAALVATSGFALVTIGSNARFDTVGFHLGIPWYQYLYSQAWAIAHYLRLVVWPDQLTFDYGYRPIDGLRGIPGLILLTAFGVATIAAWTRPTRWGWFGFLGALCFMVLAPSSSVVPITTEIAAERRIYLALAPVLLLAVIGVMRLSRRVASRSNVRGWSGRAAFATILVLLGATTFERSRTYASSEALWRDTVQKAPNNARAYDNLASTMFYDEPPRLAEAKELYSRAIALDSGYLHAWPGLASVAVDEGRFGEAEWLLEHVLTIDPGYADAVEHLGALLLKMGQPARAIPYLQRFVAAYPSDNAFIALGTAYAQVGRFDDGVAAFRKALELNPSRTGAMRNLGGLLVEQGRGADAVPVLERAVARDASSPVTVGLLSVAYAEVGRVDDAVREARRASAGARDDSSVLMLAGRAMMLVHRAADAEQYFSAALRLSPSSQEASGNLETARRALAKRTKYGTARDRWRRGPFVHSRTRTLKPCDRGKM